MWVLSVADGSVIGTYYLRYPRFAALIDWDSDGLMEIVIPSEHGIFNARGRREVDLVDALPLGGPGTESPMVRVADVCGDARDEVILFNAEAIQIYTNTTPARDRAAAPGDPLRHTNFTYY